MCATVGAACFFSAISRQSLSVVVIMLEVSGAPAHVLKIVMGTIISKLVADHFTHSLFKSLLQLKCIPLLDAELHVPNIHLMTVPCCSEQPCTQSASFSICSNTITTTTTTTTTVSIG